MLNGGRIWSANLLIQGEPDLENDTLHRSTTLNLLSYLVLCMLYLQVIAKKITTMECPRTQTEYENSYTFKMFLFQFINYYSSLIYTAFFKVRLYFYITQ